MPFYVEAAGCPNTCRHCARGGRPPYGALYSLDELRELAHEWGPLVVDYEPTAHPDFPEVMDPGIFTFEGGVLATNGFGLARAAKPEDVFARLREFGYCGLSLTLHGLEDHHDWFVGRRGAYQDILAASTRAQEAGFGVHWNIFLDNRNLEDVPVIADFKKTRFGDSLWVGVPQHAVSRRMWRYEQLRPSATDVQRTLPQLRDIHPDRWRQPLEQQTEAAWLALWRQGSDAAAFANRWEPKSWPPTEALEDLEIFVARDRKVYLEPLCAPRMLLGWLDEGRPVIEARLRALSAPPEDVDAETAERRLRRADLLHPTGSSVRYKAISAALYGDSTRPS